MYSVKTRGVVIKRMNYGEADRILTVFTDRLGKIKVLAKGVRKISSKLAGSLEPYNLLDMELHRGKTFFTITSAAILHCLECDKQPLLSNQAVYLAEIIDKVFEEEEKNTKAFELFAECLKNLNHCSSSNLNLRLFELKILEQAGFQPDLYHCAKCKNKLLPGGNFVSKSGELQCTECTEATADEVPDNVIKLLRVMQRAEVSVAGKIKCAEADQVAAEKYLDQLLQNALEREIKSKKYL